MADTYRETSPVPLVGDQEKFENRVREAIEDSRLNQSEMITEIRDARIGVGDSLIEKINAQDTAHDALSAEVVAARHGDANLNVNVSQKDTDSSTNLTNTNSNHDELEVMFEASGIRVSPTDSLGTLSEKLVSANPLSFALAILNQGGIEQLEIEGPLTLNPFGGSVTFYNIGPLQEVSLILDRALDSTSRCKCSLYEYTGGSWVRKNHEYEIDYPALNEVRIKAPVGDYRTIRIYVS